MKIAWTAACSLVAWDCAEKAMGLDAQHIFAADLVWLWWVPVAIWTVIAVGTAFNHWQIAS